MELSRKILVVFLFSMVMAYLESAVVVYLRELYYPSGFTFPLKIIPDKILIIELGRELATIIMLVTIALIAGKIFVEKVAYFLFAFGVWDIFYYIWLKVFINWPASLLTDDLLFLIPVPWISPVLAPVLVSVIFISFSILALRQTEAGSRIKFMKSDIILILIGVILILFGFICNFEERLNSTSPVEFMWEVFLIGLLSLSVGLLRPAFSIKQ
ncbi:Hypothetical protein IALB_0278 [Ignavibacterium album JCM 16511]|uniref:Uncharacterized protein n=1 Tax=Ignavibacterium album (strain DSM 19864 / JCM 16511 / NBRC 101810 / Mat9-16) TaxID=945713 RepID=I0AG83_IGNAJ|nr:hypothetical protein [Ignavibacterium album]AFH47990.1 Hypothetical protein IALB_0278 [Ignavibacterium album JCM 16511]